MTQQPLRWAALIVIAALAGCERVAVGDALDYRPMQFATSELVRSATPAWSALITDLNSDGIEEIVLTGHRGTLRPGFCTLDGSAPCQWQPFLDQGKDRHDCTDGDVDADGDIDLYCTSGADRGAGLGPNEVWRQIEPLIFESVPDALGASEASSRGRLATFIDFNRDAWPDLVTTAWGTRSDGKDNRSKLWVNVAGVFHLFELRLPDAFGARCLTTDDVDRDGFIDLLGCPSSPGLTLLRNHRASMLEVIAVGDPSDWYWDAQLLASGQNELRKIISTGGNRGEMFVEIAQLTRTLEIKERRRISCWQAAVDDNRDVYCGRLLLHDADGDGHTDILVSRRKGFRHENVLGDAPDLVIFGPSFQTFADLPMTAFGASEVLFATESGIVQVNAGEAWPGSVDLLQVVLPPKNKH